MAEVRPSSPEAVNEFLGEIPEQIQRRALAITMLSLYRRHEISAGRVAWDEAPGLRPLV